MTTDDVEQLLQDKLSLRKLVCTKFKTKFNTCVSFYVSVVDDFAVIRLSDVWPSGCLMAPCYKLPPDQVYSPSIPVKITNTGALVTPDARTPVMNSSVSIGKAPGGGDSDAKRMPGNECVANS